MFYTMAEKMLGQIIKEARKKADLSQEKLAELVGVSRQYIGKLEAGEEHDVSTAKRKAISKVLKIPIKQILDIEDTEYEASKLITERMEEMLRTAAKDVSSQVSGVRATKLLGYVPAGYPLPNEQQALGTVLVPMDQLGSAKYAKNLFALIVSGDSLIGDKIYSGFHVVIDPDDREVTTQDKIYLVRVDNEVTIKHVEMKDDRPILHATNGAYKDMMPNNLEILGRVVWKGYGEGL